MNSLIAIPPSPSPQVLENMYRSGPQETDNIFLDQREATGEDSTKINIIFEIGTLVRNEVITRDTDFFGIIFCCTKGYPTTETLR